LKPVPFQGESLRPGDRILAVNGIDTPDLETFVTVASELPAAASVTYRIERAGEAGIEVLGPFPFPPIADGVQPQSAAIDAGLQAGDVILSVNTVPVSSFTELREIVGASAGMPQTLEVWRGGEVFSATLTPRRMDIPLPEGGFETRWLIGLSGGLVFTPETRTPGPLEVVGMAVEQTWMLVRSSLSGMAHMISGAISTCNLQGPIGIAETSGDAASQGAASFLWFLAVLSTAVGLMNLFPIPVLDGGHLVFHAWEAVTGKPPSERALRVLMSLGLTVLLTLMGFALFNDLFC
jgi:regulator of sigma E protease